MYNYRNIVYRDKCKKNVTNRILQKEIILFFCIFALIDTFTSFSYFIHFTFIMSEGIFSKAR
jgi:hypothetical protein